MDRKIDIILARYSPQRPLLIGLSQTLLSTKPVDFSAEAVYFMRVLAVFIRPIGKTELEYRIIAVNKAGVGSPSNTAMVVL